MAASHLYGLALQWYRWYSKFKGYLTLREFSRPFLQCFGPTEYEEPSQSLNRLYQTTMVLAYQAKFESQCIDGHPKPFLIGAFIGGLRDEIRMEAKMR